MIQVGKKAPDFVAPADHDGRFVSVKLSEYLGKWILLCFYPGDFTSFMGFDRQTPVGNAGSGVLRLSGRVNKMAYNRPDPQVTMGRVPPIFILSSS